MRKLIARAFSDLHIHKFRAFDKNGSRLNWTFTAWESIIKGTKVPILFAGDLIHNPKEVENETISKALKFFNVNHEMESKPLYAISGNHDQSQDNTENNISPSHLDGFCVFNQFHKVDNRIIKTENFNIGGIPYYTNDIDFIKATGTLKPLNNGKLNILLCHSDVPGAVTPEGIVLDSTPNFPKNIDKLFKGWDLVLFGHIHKPQKLSEKCYMLGSPIHQTAGDAGTNMGYWDVYADGSIEFIPLVGFPRFIKLEEGKEPYNDVDYFIFPNEIVKEEELEKGDFDLTSNSRKSLAKKYLKIKGIKDKSKLRLLIKTLNYAE